jgi:N-acyl-phosphatidylethanolamine-hydrolysing phospholipase D
MNRRPWELIFFLLISSFLLEGCSPLALRFLSKAFEQSSLPMDTVRIKNAHPILPSVGLSILWVGHASCLIQIGDKVILTDPVFTNSIGMIARRYVEPGLLASSVSKLDIILISHIHFDHLNYKSLSLLPKSANLIVTAGSGEYIPEFGFADYQELSPWQSKMIDGVKITAVPVKHFNGRYGFDALWSSADVFTGYIIECQGKTVFFAGDTGYDPEKFKEIGRRYTIDAALIPIAPMEPRDFMRRVHTDPTDALQVFEDVKAKVMIPIHHRTFMQGFDSTLTYARDQLSRLAAERHLESRVQILDIGEQRVLIP